MDAKSLAKSKRAHSLHHKKKHPTHQGLKVPSVGKQAKEQTQQSHDKQIKERNPHNRGSRTLPSNWDRYDEEFNLAAEETQASSNQPTESVVPKSKGADYAYLMSEAKAQSQLQHSSGVLPQFDDFISDYTQDFGPLLATKGQNILSWIADDSFEFESEASSSIEVPFLSINLNALAEQLKKAKLSERLYLQPDVVPLELLDDIDEYDHQTHTSAAETNTKNGQHHPSIIATGDLVQTSEEESTSQELDRSNTLVSGNPPKFEATSAEAELDMLLNSFSETMTLESSGASLTGIALTVYDSGASKVDPVLKPGNIDDVIDSLLEETSIADDEHKSFGTKANTESVSSSIPKSEIIDDFDSWLDTI